ncbi:tyrosine-type recombinase/integrase [Yinghuangia soli]|uniref:Site-specific integrase n=1 Tax=Yinghuangia soli TaxID=2908204 RepID=A0AA41QBX0_9ACTN|nr:tyrosine-type recombinase/integrase [Yinghuangia soli]MCF2533952.1 site-specific integrase [Yinghuangia soli]
MRSSSTRGRVYRRCGCRDADRHQRGAHCSRLAADPMHGSWAFAVDVPAPRGVRTTVRRSGFAGETTARNALRRLLDAEACGFDADPNQTVADYLTTWLAEKELALKPATYARYRDYVRNDLVPGLGALRLDDLGHRQILAFVRRQLDAGRGRTTLYRCLATLSSALGDAVRHHRLASNPASPPAIPRPSSPERTVWTAEEAARFLDYARDHDPLIADLCEVLIGTGMRKGEALGLHWDDVHLEDRVLYVRWTLSAVDNTRLVITTPKTRSSRNWVAISSRVDQALRHRATQQRLRPAGPQTGPLAGLVFTRTDGQPLRPQNVLSRFRRLAGEAGLPRITVHDLRHLAATLTITAGVPLVIVSKTLRHSTLSTTANIYAHLTRPAAKAAVTTIQRVLAQAEERLNTAHGLRPSGHGPTPPEDRTWLQQVTDLLPHEPAPGRTPPPAHLEHETTLRPPHGENKAVRDVELPALESDFRSVFRQLGKACDHLATTRTPDAGKAALSLRRERPATCVNAGRDDRI